VIEETKFLIKHEITAKFEIGRRLILIREQEGVPTLGQVLEEHFPGLTRSAAYRYMLFSKKVTELPKIRNFAESGGNWIKAIALLESHDEDELAALEAGESVTGMTLDDVDKMSFRELKTNLRKEKEKNKRGQEQVVELESQVKDLQKNLKEAQSPPELEDQDIFKELFNLRISLGGLILQLEKTDITKSAAVANEALATMEWYRREINIAVLELNSKIEDVAAELGLTNLDPVASIEWEMWTKGGKGAHVRDMAYDPTNHQEAIDIPTIDEVLANAEGRNV
jgi:hypothetical protein